MYFPNRGTNSDESGTGGTNDNLTAQIGIQSRNGALESKVESNTISSIHKAVVRGGIKAFEQDMKTDFSKDSKHFEIVHEDQFANNLNPQTRNPSSTWVGNTGTGNTQSFEELGVHERKFDKINQQQFPDNRRTSNQPLLSTVNEFPQPHLEEIEGGDKKKGISKFYLNDQEEEKYLSYVPKKPEYLEWDNIKLSKNFALKQYKESTYMGLLDANKKRSGQGVITYNSGRFFEGSWHDDKRNGMGFETFAQGNTYEGEYSDGKVHGQGKYVWHTGEYFDGQWQRGQKYGYGVWQGLTGDTYIGEWQDNQPNGFGKHVWGN